jgi:hypothetical protein
VFAGIDTGVSFNLVHLKAKTRIPPVNVIEKVNK